MLHKIHRAGAGVLGVFLTLHLFNHLLAIGGPEAHIHFMEPGRRDADRAAFSGSFYGITVPAKYLATFQ
jgi:hypothetical protein